MEDNCLEINSSCDNTITIKAWNQIEPFYTKKIPVWKRYFDFTVSLALIILFFPVFLIISVLIKSVSCGPIFFVQERIGFGGRSFNFIKFRTMVADCDTSKHKAYLAKLISKSCQNSNPCPSMYKLDDCNTDIIPFGKFLRSTCLDELPQLFNVFKGEMSLVGPRPPIPYEVEEYMRWHKGRFDAVPGMTGLWQVSGKNKLSFREMVRFDIQYARNISLMLDLKILLKTPGAIFSQINSL